MKNRMDKLAHCKENGEGIISISLSCNGAREFDRNLELAEMLVKSGVNQLMLITYNTNAGFIGSLAPAERTFVKMGIEHGSYETMWEDNVRVLREKYPELPIIVTPMVGDIITFGQHTFLNKCVELGVDGLDTAQYRCVSDPTGLRKDCEERNLCFIPAINGGGLSVDKPETLKTMDEQASVAFKELFLVPAMPGSKNGINGEYWKPFVERIRRVQKEVNREYPIIGIGGITTAEDARQIVKISGVDGIHFSSAFMKRLFANQSLDEIGEWLKEVKKAISS